MSHLKSALALVVLATGCATVRPSSEPPAYDGPPSAVLEHHCSSGDRAACRMLGELYLSGTGVEKSDGLAVTMFLIACDQGDAGACKLAGDVYAASGEKADAAAAGRCYWKACTLGDKASCAPRGRRVAGKDKRT